MTLKKPFIDIGGVWEPNDVERRAARELYIELITRVAVVPLPDHEGLDRDALTSLYQLFAVHREVLRRAGPDVAEPKSNGRYNLGFLAVAVLNYSIRPFLSAWHPRLSHWEASRPNSLSATEHEQSWPEHTALRTDLNRVRAELKSYAHWLSQACGVPDILAAVPQPTPNQSILAEPVTSINAISPTTHGPLS